MYSATVRIKKVTLEDVLSVCNYPFVIINERNNLLLIDVCLDNKDQLQSLGANFAGFDFKHIGIWKKNGCKYGTKKNEIGSIVDDPDEQDEFKNITLDEDEYLDLVPDDYVAEVPTRPIIARQVHNWFGWDDKII
jgi:hypothetical protein